MLSAFHGGEFAWADAHELPQVHIVLNWFDMLKKELRDSLISKGMRKARDSHRNSKAQRRKM